MGAMPPQDFTGIESRTEAEIVNLLNSSAPPPKFFGPSTTPGESSGVPILTHCTQGILFHTQSCLTSVVVRSRRGSHLHSHRKTIAASVSKVGN